MCTLLPVMLIFIGFNKSTYLSFLRVFFLLFNKHLLRTWKIKETGQLALLEGVLMILWSSGGGTEIKSYVHSLDTPISLSPENQSTVGDGPFLGEGAIWIQ